MASETRNVVLHRGDNIIVVRITDDHRVVLDDEPYVWELLRAHKIGLWRRKHSYPCCWINGKRKDLQRIIANAPDDMCVHHRDGNGYNCCRSNLVLKKRYKMLCDAKKLVTPVPGIYKRENGFVARWVDRSTGINRYKLFAFKYNLPHVAYNLAMRHIASKASLPIYPRYYVDPSPIKSDTSL